jgi:hypothetical protein
LQKNWVSSILFPISWFVHFEVEEPEQPSRVLFWFDQLSGMTLCIKRRKRKLTKMKKNNEFGENKLIEVSNKTLTTKTIIPLNNRKNEFLIVMTNSIMSLQRVEYKELKRKKNKTNWWSNTRRQKSENRRKINRINDFHEDDGHCVSSCFISICFSFTFPLRF